jgi:hypothetical protein
MVIGAGVSLWQPKLKITKFENDQINKPESDILCTK